MTETGSAQQQEKIHFRNSQLNMLAFGRESPFLRGWNPLISEGVGNLAAGEKPPPVNPGPKVGRDRNIRRTSYYSFCQSTVALSQKIEDFAEAGLGRNYALCNFLRAGGSYFVVRKTPLSRG